MNALRILLLHLASVAAIIAGGSLLYDSYQDFSWGRKALAEAPRNDLTTRLEITEASAKKNSEGSSAMSVGLLLISAGLLMDGLSSVLKKLPRIPVAVAAPKPWHRFCFSKPRLVHPLVTHQARTHSETV